MEPDLTIPVTYKGEELELPATIVPRAWGFGIRVHIGGLDVLFEKDDAGEYRAIAPPDADTTSHPLPDYALLEAIAQVLTQTT